MPITSSNVATTLTMTTLTKRPPIAGARLIIDTGAIADNYRYLKQLVGPTVDCAPVLKANAYGLGVKKVSRALCKAGAETFYVATLEEGIALRKLNRATTIYVLHGLWHGQESEFTEHHLIPVLNDPYQIELWRAYAHLLQQPLHAIVHMDSGMCRLGLSLKEMKALASKVGALDGLTLDYIMSHLACPDTPAHIKNSEQLKDFVTMHELFPQHHYSFCSSSGIFLGKDYHFDQVRPGCALYGINPTGGPTNPMRQVLSIVSYILQVRTIDSPHTVGYGATYAVKPGATLAVIPLGYADGYPRSLSNTGYCSIGGYQAPIAGRISMDTITLDVSHIPPHLIHPGAEVEVIGEHCSVNALAEKAGTIGYEVLTRLGNRFKREYV